MPFDDVAKRELMDLLDRGQRAAEIMVSRPLLKRIRDLVEELERMRQGQRLLEKVDEAFKERRDEAGPQGQLLGLVHTWLVAR